MSTDKLYLQDLLDHLLSAKDPESMNTILQDLLTPSELSEISKRLQIIRLLETGMPQRQIAETLGVGIATVTRGSRALKEK
jgi:TrpR family trp operon transcriptional repressor